MSVCGCVTRSLPRRSVARPCCSGLARCSSSRPLAAASSSGPDALESVASSSAAVLLAVSWEASDPEMVLALTCAVTLPSPDTLLMLS